MEELEMDVANLVRVVVIKIDKPYGSEVYDELIADVKHANEFTQKYSDIGKYRIVTV